MDPQLSLANFLREDRNRDRAGNSDGPTVNGPPYFDLQGRRYENLLTVPRTLVSGCFVEVPIFDIFRRSIIYREPIIYSFVPIPGFQEQLNAQSSSSEVSGSDQENQPEQPSDPQTAITVYRFVPIPSIQEQLNAQSSSPAQRNPPEEPESDWRLLFDENFLSDSGVFDKFAVHECFERCM